MKELDIEIFGQDFIHICCAMGAIAAASEAGRGDRKLADKMAVEAMRDSLNSMPIEGRIVIGEGERDEAPMLYIGENVGIKEKDLPEVDIAVDPLEGTNMCATLSPGAMCAMAWTEKGGLLNAPDIYMEKLIVGPLASDAISMKKSVKENLGAISDALDKPLSELVVVILERDRHKDLISEVRKAGARIRLIQDGDLSPSILTCKSNSGIDAVMGIGGAPEGVLAAAALKCLGGGMEARLVQFREGDEERLKKFGIRDIKKIYNIDEIVPATRILFCATGVTDGELVAGVKESPYFLSGPTVDSEIYCYGMQRLIHLTQTFPLTEEETGVEQ